MERVTLRDGSAVMIRLLERDDVELVQAIFEQMGEESRYRRFLGYKKRLSPRDLDTLTEVDHHGREALVALDAESGDAVGVARMIRHPTHADAAEAARRRSRRRPSLAARAPRRSLPPRGGGMLVA